MDLTVSGCTFKSNKPPATTAEPSPSSAAPGSSQASLFASNAAQTNGGGVFLGSGIGRPVAHAGQLPGQPGLGCGGWGLFDLSNDPVALANWRFQSEPGFPRSALTPGRNTAVTVTDSVLTNNHPGLLDGVGGAGGVVGEDGAHLEMTRCTVSGNVGDRGAGGIEMGDGTLQLSDCAVTGNTAQRGLAGGLVLTGTAATVIQCTIAANSGAGGGIAAALGSAGDPTTLNVYNSTIAFNKGGGIVGDSATIALVSTIVADNTRNHTFSDLDNPDAAGNPGPAIAADHCLIRTLAATAVVTGANNPMGVDPEAVLAGRSTAAPPGPLPSRPANTAASASPAIDAGSNPLQLVTDRARQSASPASTARSTSWGLSRPRLPGRRALDVSDRSTPGRLRSRLAIVLSAPTKNSRRSFGFGGRPWLSTGRRSDAGQLLAAVLCARPPLRLLLLRRLLEAVTRHVQPGA